MPMKSIKISEAVHKELKVFTANSGESISTYAGYAIMLKLKNDGHKFVVKPKPKK